MVYNYVEVEEAALVFTRVWMVMCLLRSEYGGEVYNYADVEEAAVVFTRVRMVMCQWK